MGRYDRTFEPSAIPPSADQPSATRRYDPHLTILFFLWLLMLVAVLPVFFATPVASPTQPTSAPGGSVNPNIAPWWELTVLPRIGPHTARAIVRYRESRGKRGRSSESGRHIVAFRRAADLAQVRGIGPKTLQRIGRYLSFDDVDLEEGMRSRGMP